MNSALQCLSNTVELKEYFVSGKYKSEINKTNPLGMKGKVAEEFGALIKVTDYLHECVHSYAYSANVEWNFFCNFTQTV
jgi:ubiquitin C-terminal hydrolase